MYDFPVKDSYTLDDLKRLTGILRAPDGCPWDHVQTHQSIRRDFLEEMQELLQYRAAGAKVKITISRADNGKYVEQKVEVTLGSKN